MRRSFLALAGIALILSGCDQRTEQQKAEQAMGRPMTLSAPAHVATSGPFDIYYIIVPTTLGNMGLWVVPGATVTWTESCGKNCTRTQSVAPPGNVPAPQPVPTDPRLTGLAKLTPEERAALGLSQ